MRPVSVFAKGPAGEIEQLQGELRGRWRRATRAVMVLLSLHGLPPAQIAALPDCHPATARRWTSRFNREGLARLAGRPRCGRPAPGGRRLAGRIAALLARPRLWTLPPIRRYLGWPQISTRTLYRRVRLVASWRRPKLTARGDPDHDHVVAGIAARLRGLPRRAAVLAEDQTHLNLLPHVRASWTLRGSRPEVLTPGTNRKVTVLEVSTGRWVYRLGRRRAADFIALPDQVLQAFPQAPVIAVICDNDSIYHAGNVTAYLQQHPRLELLYGARYSPHDNPAERIWWALKNYAANTAVSWPGRLRQIHSFFRNPSPDQMLATAAPWTSPGCLRVTSRTSGMALSKSDCLPGTPDLCGWRERYLSEYRSTDPSSRRNIEGRRSRRNQIPAAARGSQQGRQGGIACSRQQCRTLKTAPSAQTN
jgi:transposase